MQRGGRCVKYLFLYPQTDRMWGRLIDTLICTTSLQQPRNKANRLLYFIILLVRKNNGCQTI